MSHFMFKTTDTRELTDGVDSPTTVGFIIIFLHIRILGFITTCKKCIVQFNFFVVFQLNYYLITFFVFKFSCNELYIDRNNQTHSG